MVSLPTSEAEFYELQSRRIRAAWIDVVLLTIVGLAILWLTGHREVIHSSGIINGRHFRDTGSARGFTLAGGLICVGISLAYYFVLEAVWGQTVGKRLMRVHVTTVTGQLASRGAIAVRTLARIVDFLPGWYLGGWLVMRVGGRPRQRVGDHWAHTTVSMSSRRE